MRNDLYLDDITSIVIGFGSLIHVGSLSETVPRYRGHHGSLRLPTCRLHGWRRDWNVGMDVLGLRFLDAHPVYNDVFNAVMIPVSDTDLDRLDNRECIYDRVICNDAVHDVIGNDLSGTLDLDMPIWIYTGLPEHRTSRGIVTREYWEIVIDGCLDISKSFRDEFLRTTMSINRDK